ncbi:hypothetical protein TL16_g05539 [Triparma laevis f. inornata]|uniref:Agmatine deiminase n=2 Tax=Triparma laevis TaxID=1534972 RepID=A0A9W7A0K7_9STRA|nr:hypothetical protein TrLO_g9125 [Triparma laevis f. longispina]GMH70986.1 hypothetical protein TL16_g05539 [Triparma laevis f. inornata]
MDEYSVLIENGVERKQMELASKVSLTEGEGTEVTEVTDVWRHPAEWEPHYGCIILWPHNTSTFNLPLVKPELYSIIEHISTSETLLLYLPPHQTSTYDTSDPPIDPTLNEIITLSISPSHSIIFKSVASNDTWARDTSPIFLTSSPSSPPSPSFLKSLSFNFNAYGGPLHGCYWPCSLDVLLSSKITEDLAEDLGLEEEKHLNFVFEGGSFCTNGRGVMLTTEECLVEGFRNEMSKDEISSYLLKTFNLLKISWLPHGLYADNDTNGHCDNFCCFLNSNTVGLAWTDDKDDPQFDRSDVALKILEGEGLRVVKIPLPKVQYLTSDDVNELKVIDSATERIVGERLAASYINFYISNNKCIVPAFGDEMDEVARRIIEREVGREAVSVFSRNLLVGGGNVHCQTMQVPVGVGL